MRDVTDKDRRQAAIGLLIREPGPGQQVFQRAAEVLGALDDLPPHERPRVLLHALVFASYQADDPRGVIETAIRLLEEAPLNALPDDDEVRRYFAEKA